MEDGLGWLDTFRLMETANGMIYRGHMREFLNGEADPFDLDMDKNPPFSVFLDIMNYYYSVRRLELILSRIYPIPIDPTQFYRIELDVRQKTYLG